MHRIHDIRQRPGLRFQWFVLWVVALAGLHNSFAESPEYFISPRYPSSGSLYIDIADNRTLTSVGRERDWDNGGAYTGKLFKNRTTGAFDSNGVPQFLSTTIPEFPGNKILQFKGFRNPVTTEGDLLLWIGTTDEVGGPATSKGAIWKADDNTVLINPINGSVELVPMDMNESRMGCGYILHPFVNAYDQDRKRAEPVLFSPSGTVSIIQPSRISEYGYEAQRDGSGSWVQPTMDNEFKAVAINNQGAVVCTGKGVFKVEGRNRYYTVYWSFVSRNGTIVADELPAGASDINDRGEVVGYNNEGTWLYLPAGRYGLPPGVSYIDTVRYTDGYDDNYRFLDIQPLINNQGDVTWLGTHFSTVGAPTYPTRLWKNGSTDNLTDLFETEEAFNIRSVTEMNEKGDLLLLTTYTFEYEGQTYNAFANRILSTRPFQTELVVNVTDDLPDADPNDKVIDVDLDKAGLQVSLRAAVDAVNDDLASKIEFDIPGDNIPVIILIQALPPITQPVTIDGTTQAAGKVEVRGGAFAGAGFHLQGGASEVRGMVLNGFNGPEAAAVRISGPGENVIKGNWLGTDASGNQVRKTQFGVLIEGSAGNTIGGESASDRNIIYGATAGIDIREAGSDDNRILGNRIGIGANNAIFTPLMGSGISQSAGSGSVIGNAGNGKNWIATLVGISLGAASTMDNIKVTGNWIGLDGTGTLACNGSGGILIVASDDADLKKVTVEDNKIAGHAINLLVLDGGGLGEVVLRNNEIGLAFTGSGQPPSGMTKGTQEYGIRLDGPMDARVTENVVAAHNYNLLLSGILQIFVFGGVDTDGDGEPDSNFSVSITNPDDSEQPDAGDPVAEKVAIKNNHVGVDRLNRLPANSPEQLVGIANFGGARGTEIDGNTIGGHSQVGLWIESGREITADLNHIGVSSGGLPLPNGAGIKIGEALVSLKDNTVAQNANIGILIDDLDNAVKILGGSYYKNGTGAAALGISYEAGYENPLEDLFVFRSNIDANTGMVDVTFAIPALLDEDSNENNLETTLEIWGNRNNAETQGRTLLLSKPYDPTRDFSHKVTVKPDSAFVSAQNFTTTLTRNAFTSPFSQPVLPKALEWPRLDFAPPQGQGGVTIKEDEVAFEWAIIEDPELFILEEASSFAGPWRPVSASTSVDNGKAQVTVSLKNQDEQFFRLRINPSALSDSSGSSAPAPLELELVPTLSVPNR